MDQAQEIVSQLFDYFWADPLRGTAALAAILALAFTPIAFAVLGRREYLYTRRGRTYRRPEWWSVVCSMMLVMGIPAIVLVLLVKSQYFDENRYEFDPNRTWTVKDQGRQYGDLAELDEAMRLEMERLARQRRELVEAVLKLDESMLELRAVIDQAPQIAQTLPDVLEGLADIRQAVGVDAPQQLMDYTAPPVDLARMPRPLAPYGYAPMPGPDLGTAPIVAAEAPGAGLSTTRRASELASVPEPQKKIAAMLPLTALPEGWEVGKSGDRHLETFGTDDLYEKIDGRAESFVQYDVVGMAYTYYNPEGDPSAEVQVYIFEMGSPLKALGKYGSERPDEAEPIELGSNGYASGASIFFHAGPYYTQIVPTSDSPEFREFAQELAERIAEEQAPGKRSSAAPIAARTPEEDASAEAEMPAEAGTTNVEPEPDPADDTSPDAIFALLPDNPGRGGDKYVAQDVFGYAFLSDVFMADYADDATTWQAFVRPYPDAETARTIFDQYRGEAEAFDADIKEVETESADALFVSENFGLIDVIFLKGNAVGGVNGASDVESARAFAESFAESMPATSPFME
ncbi:hypothetical protein BH23PLA1_BH23PLA1_24240 [soil metagenome]